MVNKSCDQLHDKPFADNYPLPAQIRCLGKDKAGQLVFTQQIARIEQQTVTDHPTGAFMVMATADHIIPAAGCKAECDFRIMMTPYAQAACFDIHGNAVVADALKYCPAPGGDQVLVTDIVAVNQVNITIKPVQVGEHERRDQVAAVDEQLCSGPVGMGNGPGQVGDVVVTVGEDGDFHSFLPAAIPLL